MAKIEPELSPTGLPAFTGLISHHFPLYPSGHWQTYLSRDCATQVPPFLQFQCPQGDEVHCLRPVRRSVTSTLPAGHLNAETI